MNFLDRHRHVVFPLCGVIVGIAPALVMGELAGYGSHFWTGVGLGTFGMLAMLPLEFSRRIRTAGFVLLQLGIVVTCHIALKTSAPWAMEVLNLPGIVEAASAAATSLAWVSATLFFVGLTTRPRHDPRRGHRGWVEGPEPPGTAWYERSTEYVAACTCGWRDTAREKSIAFVKVRGHAGRVAPQVRPRRGGTPGRGGDHMGFG